MGSKGLNPADAHRRAQKKKQIAKNKKHRELTREARALVENPQQLKEKLQGLLDTEERESRGREYGAGGTGVGGPGPISMKRQVYQKAYEAAIVKQRENQARIQREEKAAAAEKRRREQQLQEQGVPPPLPPPHHHQQGVLSSGFVHRTSPPAHFVPRSTARPPAARHNTPQHRYDPRRVGGVSSSTGGVQAPPLFASRGSAVAPPHSPGQVRSTVSAAPELTIKRAEKNEKLVAMVPASLRAKQKQKINKAKQRFTKTSGSGMVGGGGTATQHLQKNIFNINVGSAHATTTPTTTTTTEPEAEAPSSTSQKYAKFLEEMDGLGAFQ